MQSHKLEASTLDIMKNYIEVEMKINYKLLTNSLQKNLSHRPSTALQDLQYGKLCEFPHSD